MQTIFERSEKKYILTPIQCQQFYDRIRKYLECDVYDDYTIYNIYFDTEHYDLIRNSIEKPPYKEKLRIRCYDTDDEQAPVFVELKKKYDHVVFKRRIQCTMKEAQELIYEHKPLSDQHQIVSEILYFLKFYQPSPKLFLSYDRRAFHGIQNTELRITLDSNIQYRTHELDFNRHHDNKAYFQNHQILMEIKSHYAFPLWLSAVLSEMELYPTSFSKYGKIYEDCLLPKIRKEISYV